MLDFVFRQGHGQLKDQSDGRTYLVMATSGMLREHMGGTSHQRWALEYPCQDLDQYQHR